MQLAISSAKNAQIAANLICDKTQSEYEIALADFNGYENTVLEQRTQKSEALLSLGLTTERAETAKAIEDLSI